MYKLGFLTLILSSNTAQVVCEDNGLDKCAPQQVPQVVVCDDSSTCVTSTSTLTSKPTSTSDAKQGSISSFAEKNSAMYIFGLLPLFLL